MASTTDTVRYGIIGSGMMGLEHLWNLHHIPGASVTAIADPHQPSRAFTIAMDEGRNQITEFDDHRQLLASGLVDAVIVSTPNMTHREVLDDVLATDLHLPRGETPLHHGGRLPRGHRRRRGPSGPGL